MKRRFAIYVAAAALLAACQPETAKEAAAPLAVPADPVTVSVVAASKPHSSIQTISAVTLATLPSINGFMLGASPDAFLAAFPNAKCRIYWSATDCEVTHVSYEGFDGATLTVSFRDLKATSIWVKDLDKDISEDLYARLVAKYGPSDGPPSTPSSRRSGKDGWVRTRGNEQFLACCGNDKGTAVSLAITPAEKHPTPRG